MVTSALVNNIGKVYTCRLLKNEAFLHVADVSKSHYKTWLDDNIHKYKKKNMDRQTESVSYRAGVQLS